MKSRITVFILAMLFVFGTVVSAEDVKTFRTINDTVSFESSERAVISCYDNDGTLVYSGMYNPENGMINADIPKEYQDMQLRAYIENTDTVFALEKGETPLPTQEPTPKPTAAPEKTPYPSIYPSQTDALNAFMVCEKVSMTQNEDNEPAYLIEAYYQGEKSEFIINSDVVIESAPENYLYLSGQNASALKKGDVFRITYNLSKTRVKRIDFIYRPDIKTIAYDNTDYGDDFESLFSYGGSVGGMKNWTVATYGKRNRSKYQYAFGIIVDKTQNTLSLMNKNGKPDEIMEIDIDKNSVVYKCDISEKYTISKSNISGITKTFVPSAVFNSEKITWTKAYDYSYALVRIIDDMATDIVVFNNF